MDDDALDINSTYPGIMARKGQLVMLVLVFAFLITLYLMPYLEKRKLECTISPATQIFLLSVNKTQVKRSAYFPASGQMVKKGTPLIILNGSVMPVVSPFDGIFYADQSGESLTLKVKQTDELSELRLPVNPDSVIYGSLTGKSCVINADGLGRSLKGYLYQAELNAKIPGIYVRLSAADRKILGELLKKREYEPLKFIVEVPLYRSNALRKIIAVAREKIKQITQN